MNRQEVMDLIRTRGRAEGLALIEPQLGPILMVQPELAQPFTIEDAKRNKAELEGRIGALALATSLAIIEAARCAECDGKVHHEIANAVYDQVGTSISSILVAVQHETDGPSPMEELVDALRGMLKRRAAREAGEAAKTARRHRGATQTATPAPEADGDRPEGTDGVSGRTDEGHPLPPGVEPGDSPATAFAKGVLYGMGKNATDPEEVVNEVRAAMGKAPDTHMKDTLDGPVQDMRQ